MKSMKSIGIITIHNCQNNYGGALQCFALYYYLQSLGVNVEVIDLHRPNNIDFIDSVRFREMRSSIGIRAFIKGWLKEIFGIKKLRNTKYYKKYNRVAEERFMTFNAKVKMSSPYCYIPDLYRNPPQYDIYISGSDQLWNPEQPYCLEPYFLTFVKDKNSKKISYGTSIGLTKLRSSEIKSFKRWLSSYDFISVREQQACDLLESMMLRPIERVPDPTFLLNQKVWNEMAKSPQDSQHYILIFYLGHNEEMIKKGIEIAQRKGCKVKVIDQNYSYLYNPFVEVVADAGPLEFIGLIKNAWLVLTNSFHCTVFSIIMGARNFYTYIAPDSSRGSRIEDLLKIFQLSNHIVTSVNAIPSFEQLNLITIDSSLTKTIMKQEQQIGRTFLERAIGK